MHVLSVNVGQAQPLPKVKAVGITGIYKRPVEGPVEITALGLVGDAVCDTEHHGGVDQAIYVYGTLDYDWWSEQLGQELAPGTFGENVTIAGFASADYSIGDRLHLGAVTLEVTAPRIPCRTLAARMGDPLFVKRFRAAERPGLYCRVIRAGFIQAGDTARVERYAGDTVTAIESFRAAYERQLDEATLRRHLAAPIAIRDRASKEEQLRKLEAQRYADFQP